MMRYENSNLPIGAISLVVVLSTCISNAATRTWDFETDPFNDLEFIESTNLDAIWGGQGFDQWDAEGNPGGFFSITEAAKNQKTIAVFPDINGGEAVQAFHLEMDLRIGNGITDRPADGFSINFARASDPMLEDVQGGSAVPGNAAASGALETGTETGVAISFDTWAGNALPDGPDLEGIIVRVDNTTVGRFAMPTRHGSADDITSIQTGPIGGSDAAPDAERGDPDILEWAKLEVDVDRFGVLNVRYKGQSLVENFEAGFWPSPGRLILMGRTSNAANQIQHVDNISLRTLSAVHIDCFGSDFTKTGFWFDICNQLFEWEEPVVESVLLNGKGITDKIQLTRDGFRLRISYDSGVSWNPESTQVVELVLRFPDGRTISGEKFLTPPDYVTIPAELALDNVDTSQPGFLLFIKQSEQVVPNRTEARLGHLVDDSRNIADDTGSDNFTWTVDLINFEQLGDPQGEFRDTGNGDAQDVQDDFIPGIPGITDSDDNITGYIQTIVRIPEAGLYTFGFNSDDGFRTTVGNDAVSQIRIGEFSGGRGASTTEYKALFEAAGDYAMQSLWYEGTGGANFEWFTIEPTKALLNDTENGGIETFAVLPNVPARVTSVSPGNGIIGVAPNSNIYVTIEDASASVDIGSVSLELSSGENGKASKSGGTTTVTIDREGVLWNSGQEVTATLTYTAGGSVRSVDWTFTVEDYPTLSKSRTDVGTGIDPGFEFRIYQTVAGRGNNTADAEMQLAGTWADSEENVADPSDGRVSNDDARPGVLFDVDLINMDQDGTAQGVFRNTGDGTSTDRADAFIPGIPGLEGSTDSISAEILTYIEFPAKGYYQMVFNSDDGFLVSETHGAGVERGVTLGVFNGGRGASDTIFGFEVKEPRIYPIRAIWYEGGGGANLEWSSIAEGTRYLINDEDGKALKAYRSRSGTPADVNIENDTPLITSVVLTDGSVVIDYIGTLKSSENVTGPYIAVEGASSPYSVEASNVSEFFVVE